MFTKIVDSRRISLTAEEEAALEAYRQAWLDSVDRLRDLRQEFRQRVRDHAVSLVSGDFPDFSTEDLERLTHIFIAITPSSRSDKLITAAQVVQYAETLASAADSLNRNQLERYDPNNDDNWPS